MRELGLQDRRWDHEGKVRKRSAFAPFSSKHTRHDLVLGVFIVIVMASLVWALASIASSDGEVRAAVIGIVGSGAAYVVQGLWERAQKRLNLVDIFAFEILSLLELIQRSQLVERFCGFYRQPLQDQRGLVGGPRESDYFQVYGGNCSELGFLEPETVRNITEFYTYLKGSRDVAQSLSLWPRLAEVARDAQDSEASIRKRDIKDILLLLEVMVKVGNEALDHLMEDEEDKDKILRHARKLRDDIATQLNAIRD